MKTLDLEPTVRRILASLPSGAAIPTRELSDRIMGERPDELDGMTLGRDLIKLADNTGLATVFEEEATKGYLAGKRVKRRIWHALDSAAMPERPHTQSAGAANAGASLSDAVAAHAERLQAVEEWIAYRDPLFRVL